MSTDTAEDDLHSNVPDEACTCLLIIDMINEFTFPGAEMMLPSAFEAAKRIAGLKRRAKEAKVPVIYVNDNFGRWQYDFNRLIAHCLKENRRGKDIVELLCPDDDDYFVLKPKHSGFFSTPLELLLKFLKARRLIVTGVAGNSCVLVTANDAYMRDFELFVPCDCVVSVDQEDNRAALEQMKKMLKADLRPSQEVKFIDQESRKL
ncbi:MAG: cysteine hydrolase family protein [Nitrospiraceae bacterium]